MLITWITYQNLGIKTHMFKYAQLLWSNVVVPATSIQEQKHFANSKVRTQYWVFVSKQI